MISIEQLKKRMANTRSDPDAEWEREYPFSIELQEKHYAWDYEIDADDITVEVEDWLVEHAGIDFSIRRRTLGFKDQDAAFAFKMAWG